MRGRPGVQGETGRQQAESTGNDIELHVLQLEEPLRQDPLYALVAESDHRGQQQTGKIGPAGRQVEAQGPQQNEADEAVLDQVQTLGREGAESGQ